MNSFVEVSVINTSHINNKIEIDVFDKNTTKNINTEKVVEKFVVEKEQTNVFKKVATDGAILVYSAYLEESSYNLRVIGLTRLKHNSYIRCDLHYKHILKPVYTSGYIKHIPENHRRRFTAMFIMCNMTGKDVPDTVSFYDKNSARHVPNAINVVKITQRENQFQFSACVSPLHSRFSDTKQLVEWIELNRLLGVEKFLFYINHISKNVFKVLEYYERKGILSILPWNIPKYFVDHPYEVHYYGQMAALNDCLYRNKGRSAYLSTTDLDEYIIPQKPEHMTWSDMIADLPSRSTYIVRSSFFRRNPACLRHEGCATELTIDSYSLRDIIILQTHKRSKFIAKTSELIVMGIHFPWALKTGSEYTIKAEVALVHHYRKVNLRYTGREPMKVPHIAARKYSANLKENIRNVTIDVFNNSPG